MIVVILISSIAVFKAKLLK